MFEESSTWENAERSCQAEGGHLGDREASGDECVRTALQTCFRDGGHTAQAYTGLSDVISLGIFRWSSDNRETTNLIFPSDTSPQCLTVSVVANGLGGPACTSQRAYICERNLSKWYVAQSLPLIIIINFYTIPKISGMFACISNHEYSQGRFFLLLMYLHAGTFPCMRMGILLTCITLACWCILDR